MLKKIGFILIGLIFVGALGFILYQVLFVGSVELKDAKITYIEGEIRDKAKVAAECSISAEDRFCFKDVTWAQKENKIEFEGYAVVEYANDSDIVTEISTNSAKLENVSPGTLTIKSTKPSDIFIAPGESIAVRYDISFDTDGEEETSLIKSAGADFKASLTNEIGKSLTEFFKIEYKN